MNTKEAFDHLADELKNQREFFLLCQSTISIEFKNECQRFRQIKQSQNLTVVDLDTIAMNAAKNVLTQFIQDKK